MRPDSNLNRRTICGDALADELVAEIETLDTKELAKVYALLHESEHVFYKFGENIVNIYAEKLDKQVSSLGTIKSWKQ